MQTDREYRNVYVSFILQLLIHSSFYLVRKREFIVSGWTLEKGRTLHP